MYVRCNGVYDCPGKEDEAECDSYPCPGFYRCRVSKVCLHVSHVCDGIFQCPQNDDEMTCDLVCPPRCTCNGLAFTCNGTFPAADYAHLRYLAAPGSNVAPELLVHNQLLVFLSLANCGLSRAGGFSFPNLRSLDISDNLISSVRAGQLAGMPSLRVLRLAGNPLTVDLFADFPSATATVFASLYSLDLSRVKLEFFNGSALQYFTHLQRLNLSSSGVDVLTDGFRSLGELRVLDLRGCPVTSYPRDIFWGLTSLREVYSDNYKLCCPATLPGGFNANNCKAPSDVVSSCDSLLGSITARVFLSLYASLSSLGNVGSFVIRVLLLKTSHRSSQDVLVTHLAASDFLTGTDLVLIGVADRVYRGSYLWEDEAWRRSAACKVSGVLSLMSSLVSSFLVFLLILECFLALRWKSPRAVFSPRSTSRICLVAWSLGVVLSAVPVLPVTSHWRVFSETGLCMPMPISVSDDYHHHHHPGRDYVFGVLIILNFVLVSFSGAIHVAVYLALVNYNVTADDPVGISPSLTSARRVFPVTVTNFLFRFLVTVAGMLASQGDLVTKQIRVATMMILLPSNAALNPFLYLLGVVRENQRRREKERLLKHLKAKILSARRDK